MKSCEEMAGRVLARREAYWKKQRKMLLSGSVLASCLALTLCVAALSRPMDTGTQLPAAVSSSPPSGTAMGSAVTEAGQNSSGMTVNTSGSDVHAGVDIPSDWTGEPVDLTLEEARQLLFGGQVPRSAQAGGLTLESCQSCQLVNQKSGAVVDTLHVIYSDHSDENIRVFSAIYYSYSYNPKDWEGHIPLSLGTITPESLQRAGADGQFNLILDGGDFCVDVDAPGCDAETVWTLLREMQETGESH